MPVRFDDFFNGLTTQSIEFETSKDAFLINSRKNNLVQEVSYEKNRYLSPDSKDFSKIFFNFFLKNLNDADFTINYCKHCHLTPFVIIFLLVVIVCILFFFSIKKNSAQNRSMVFLI
jgi:hypothetical protein